mgnify:CR=1 FL=1
MSRISAAVSATLCLFASLGAAQQYQVILDRNLSPYSGASLMISTYNFGKYLEDAYTPEQNPNSSLRWAFRTANVGIAYAINGYLMVTQHEVFGHGYRAREFGFKGVDYKIGYYTGATYFYRSDYGSAD